MKSLIKKITCVTLFVLVSVVILNSCSSNKTISGRGKIKLSIPEVPFNPLTYIVYKTNKGIKIDGKLNEKIWSMTKWTINFVNMKDGSEAKYRTRVKLLWDEHYLYIGAELEEQDLWATMAKRDDPVYLDNAFEMFFDPDGDTHNYLEFEINALETIWDLFLTKPYRDQGQSISLWNMMDYKSAVHLAGTLNDPHSKDTKWTVEFALPIKALLEVDNKHKSIKNGEQWKANFSRAERRLIDKNGRYELKENPDTNRPYPPDYTVWSPQGVNNIHYPEMWGIIQFSYTIVGQGTDTFNSNPGRRIKWALRQVYYHMHDFYSNHGYYTNDPSKLNIADIQIEGLQFDPKIQVTKTLFEVTCTGFDAQKTWHITQDGRVWQD